MGPAYGEAAAGLITGFFWPWMTGSSPPIFLVMSGTELKSIICPLSAQRYELFGPQEPASAVAAAVAAVIARARVVAIQALIRASQAWTTYPGLSLADHGRAVHTDPRRRDVQRYPALP